MNITRNQSDCIHKLIINHALISLFRALKALQTSHISTVERKRRKRRRRKIVKSIYNSKQRHSYTFTEAEADWFLRKTLSI